ncbi:MAG: spore germination protein, partial [Bacillota bacterium]|nr:spore germination protein [Bacillota bacterium]
PAAKCCLIYFDGMVNNKLLNENIIEPILNNNLAEGLCVENLLEELQYKIISANNINAVNDVNSIVNSVIYGDTIFLLEGFEKVLIIDSKGWQTRAITEPESSKVVRGPREGFTESLLTNVSLIRRIINNPHMKFKYKEIGKRTRTKTCICFIEDLALGEILTELERRLDEIDIDAVLDSGYVQELIRDAPFSPFETVGYSERPDTVASKLLEGRIALIVDGSPMVLTVPFIMIESAQSSEDYYNNFIFGSFNRLLRTTATLLSISLPALYIAVVNYHQEMLPTPLLLSISSSKQGVPFPSVVSMLIMLLIFDILREASTRMPSSIGQAVNIVGALVLGQAAVEAKLVTAHVVILTALGGMLALLNITMLGAIIVLRAYLIISAAIMGVYGFLFGFIIILLHLMNLRSFGIPYMMNITSIENHNFQDSWIRAPWWTMTLRPKIIGARNLVRQSGKKNRRK